MDIDNNTALSDLDEEMVEPADDTPNPNRGGRPPRPFSTAAKSTQRAKLNSAYQACKNVSEKEDIPMSECLGHIGARYYNGDGDDAELAKLFKKISLGENPNYDHSMTVERALGMKEKCGLGQQGYSDVRKLLSPAIEMPSRYKLDKYTKNLYPKVEKFMNGVWIELGPSIRTIFESILIVEDLDLEDEQHLAADVLLGMDGSGSHKQFQNRDIDINSRNIMLGNCFA